jgi:hypothetical protein
MMLSTTFLLELTERLISVDLIACRIPDLGSSHRKIQCPTSTVEVLTALDVEHVRLRRAIRDMNQDDLPAIACLNPVYPQVIQPLGDAVVDHLPHPVDFGLGSLDSKDSLGSGVLLLYSDYDASARCVGHRSDVFEKFHLPITIVAIWLSFEVQPLALWLPVSAPGFDLIAAYVASVGCH